MPERDLVAEQNRRFEARAAGALQIETRRLGRKTRAQDRFACQIPLGRMFDERARRDFPDTLSLQLVAFDQSAQCCREHLLIANLRVGTVTARKRNSQAADDGDASWIGSDQHKNHSAAEEGPNYGLAAGHIICR